VFLLQCTDDYAQKRNAAVKRKNFAGNLDFSTSADIFEPSQKNPSRFVNAKYSFCDGQVHNAGSVRNIVTFIINNHYC
jgi:hypothetical protein